MRICREETQKFRALACLAIVISDISCAEFDGLIFQFPLLYSHFRLVRTRLTRNFTRTKTSGPESNRIDSHTLWIRITRNQLTRNFGLYNCQIFPRRRSFRFVRRKITHSTIETDASRAFDASSAGFAVRPYLLYNFSCISYKFCRICSIFEISGFREISNFLLLLHNFGL